MKTALSLIACIILSSFIGALGFKYERKFYGMMIMLALSEAIFLIGIFIMVFAMMKTGIN